MMGTNKETKNAERAKMCIRDRLKCIDEGKDFQKELDATDEIALFMGAQNPEMAEAAAKIEKPKNGIKMLWNLSLIHIFSSPRSPKRVS